jgi:phosphoenolpyruvate carboxylase
LRNAIIRCYYNDVRKLKRRATFDGVENVLNELEKKLYNSVFIPDNKLAITQQEMLTTLRQIKDTIVYQHNGLFVDLVENLINKVEVFGLHFASLDVRQESTVHGKLMDALAGKSGAFRKNTLT